MSLQRRIWYRAIGLAALGNLLTIMPAAAHFQSAGLGDFNAGLIHPLLTLEHALALGTFGLLCGQRHAALLRFGMPSLAAGLFVGFAIAYSRNQDPAFASTALTALALLAGLSVVTTYSMPPLACIGLGFTIGTMIGLESKPETLGSFLNSAAGISGTLIGVFLLYLHFANAAAFAAKPWQSIGIRVIGSWASAAAFLNIALLFRK